MPKVNTTIRLDQDLKTQATRIAQELGISLNTVISLYLKNEFIVSQGISFKLRDQAGFTQEAGNDLKKLVDEGEKGVGVSKKYSDASQLIHDLHNHAVEY
ncbi:hypothetical protein MK079_04715 [Candidatus Gracilibacteria bacterium]|nr:hypothetical protein [Candidatus Gracilibacteria bacterium]